METKQLIEKAKRRCWNETARRGYLLPESELLELIRAVYDKGVVNERRHETNWQNLINQLKE